VLQERDKRLSHVSRKVHPGIERLDACRGAYVVSTEPDTILCANRTFLDTAVRTIAILEPPNEEAAVIGWRQVDLHHR